MFKSTLNENCVKGDAEKISMKPKPQTLNPKLRGNAGKISMKPEPPTPNPKP
jgi:hypothetical protein